MLLATFVVHSAEYHLPRDTVLARFVIPPDVRPSVCHKPVLVHGQVTIIFVVSVGLSVCLSVCLFVCAEFFSAVFDPISIKLGHMLYVWV